MSEADKTSALLTKSQRKLLRGKSDLSDRGERAAYARIRERVAAGVADFSLLFDNLDDVPPTDALDVADDEVMHGIVDAIAYLYLATTESRLNFEKVLYTGLDGADHGLPGALEKGAQKHDHIVDQVTVKTRPRVDDEFLERVHNRDPDLDRSDVLNALQKGRITQEEFWQWNDLTTGERRPGGRRGFSAPDDWNGEPGKK